LSFFNRLDSGLSLIKRIGMGNFEKQTNNQKRMDSAEGREALFEFATEGILVADSQGNIVRVNPAAEKMFGYSSGELIGKKIEVLIPKRFEHKHSGYRENYSQQPRPRSMGIGMDLFGLKKDGTELPVEISLSPFKTSDANFVIAFIIDISVRKKNEASINKNQHQLERLAGELKVTNAELEKRVRDRTLILEEALHELERSRQELSHSLEKEKELNELKSRFVAMASHEFRTPLATILSSLNLASNIPRWVKKKNRKNTLRELKAQ
jgi:PAS domain S-box-containing protein